MAMHKILVTGGAGYIGSHMSKMLVKNGYDVVVLDNLSSGYEGSVKYGELVIGDLLDLYTLEKLFEDYSFDAVMHFAAYSLVGESVVDPSKYFRNNVHGTQNLLDVMRRHNVNSFVFSSTAAIFGEPEYSPIDEGHPQNPINPYGASKLMVEIILKSYFDAYGVNSISLRYFNACGADPEGELGECHDPETHLIPIILQAASGKRKNVTIYGDDYDTEDGTCIRDYVHISDLCQAHLLALSGILSGKITGSTSFNLGNGQGFSVREVIRVAIKIVSEDGCSIKVISGRRRSGDPAVLVSDATKAREKLGWTPKYPCIDSIVQHAWEWEKKLQLYGRGRL